MLNIINSAKHLILVSKGNLNYRTCARCEPRYSELSKIANFHFLAHFQFCYFFVSSQNSTLSIICEIFMGHKHTLRLQRLSSFQRNSEKYPFRFKLPRVLQKPVRLQRSERIFLLLRLILLVFLKLLPDLSSSTSPSSPSSSSSP